MRTHHGTLAYLHSRPHQLARCFGLEKGLSPWVPAAGEFPPGLAETQSTDQFPGLAASTKNSADKSRTLGWVENNRDQHLLFNSQSPSAAPAKGCSLPAPGGWGRTNAHYSTSFLTPGYLSPDLHGLFTIRGEDDFVSRRWFIPGRQTERVSLCLGSKQYIKEVFHSLGWHHDLMTLCPSPFTIHKKSNLPLQPVSAVHSSEQRVTENTLTHGILGRDIFLIGYFRETSLCRHGFYVGCCRFYRAAKVKSAHRCHWLQANQWQG